MFTVPRVKQRIDSSLPTRMKLKIKRHRLNGLRSDNYHRRKMTHSEIYKVGKY